MYSHDCVSYCSCNELSYVHAHCPCWKCKGKAVSRSTEHRHRQLGEASSAHAPLVVATDEQEDGDIDLEQDESSASLINSTVSPLPASVHSPLATNEDSHTTYDDTNDDSSTPTENMLQRVFGQDVNKDIVVSVLKAFELLEEMNGSQKNFLNILRFGRDLYCKNDQSLLRRWPTTWVSCMNILKEAGYKEPTTYYVCLDESHPNLWDSMNTPHDACKYCRKPGTIQYHYLSLTDKVKRWCSSKEFCNKMTQHWKHKENWLCGTRDNIIYKEFWDGERFAELKWFWDPEKEWMLPAYCTTCNEVVNTDFIKAAQRMQSAADEGSSTCTSQLQLIIDCPHCYSQFNHSPRFTKGDPRNIALLGHWDGFQPFSTSPRHSCGEFDNGIICTCT